MSRYRFLIDAQLPPQLASLFREAGHEADHVTRVGLGAASDLTIYSRAFETGAVLVTKDIDFLRISEGADALVPIVWIRIGNSTNARLRTICNATIPFIEKRLAMGDHVIEVG